MDAAISDILTRLSRLEQAQASLGAAEAIPHGGANQIYKAAGWGQVVNADVDAAAAIAGSKLGTGIALSKLAGALAGFVVSNGSAINDGHAISVGDLPALHQIAVARAFSGTTGSATPGNVDGTNGIATLTTTGGTLIGLYFGNASNSSGGVIQREYLQLDSNGWGATQQVYSYGGLAGYPVPFATAEVYTGQGAGSHTLYAGHANISAVGTMTTSGVILILLELKI